MNMDENNLTDEEIIIASLMKGGGLLTQYSYNQIRSVCNGCGPEWMNEKIRRILDVRFSLFKLAFVVHDVHFAYNDDRGKDSFDKVNRELYDNCLNIAKNRFKWFSPFRYLAMLDARKLYIACDRFAWKAWTENSEMAPTLKEYYEDAGKLDEYYRRHPEG